MMFKARRLHPVAILFNMLKPIKELLFFFIIIFFSGEFLAFFVFLGVFLFVDFIFAYVSWRRFSYYVTDEALWIEYGIFKRTKRSIAKNRIQSIDLTENIIHRVTGLTKVQIETASGGQKAEAALSAVSFADAEQLREALLTKDNADLHSKDERYVVKQEISFPRLLLAGGTSGGIGIILGFLVVAFTELEELIPENIYDYTYEWLLSASIIFIVLLAAGVLFVVWLLSVGWILIRYGKFTIQRTENELQIRRGILERKQLTIPLHRIQAIGIEENLLRQPLGYASVFAEIAGGDTDDQLTESTILFPLLHKREIKEFLHDFVPNHELELAETKWVKPPPSALPFYCIRYGFSPILVSILVLLFFPSFAWIPLAALALSLVLGWMSYKDTGFQISDSQLLLRKRHIKRISVLFYYKRMQAFERKQHAWERKNDLASFKASILSNRGGKHYQVKNVKAEEINPLIDHINNMY